MPSKLSAADRSRYIVQRLRHSSLAVSGEVLAAELGISRVALWKRIESLRAWGYCIESSHSGYSLEHDDGLSVWDIAVPGRLFLHDELDSTMDEAHLQAMAGAPDGSLVLALRQRAGRTLDGGAWPSPDGGLYASLILRAALPVHYADALLMEAVRIVRRLLVPSADGTGGEPGAALRFVWPHSLYCGNKKVAGFLLEQKGRPAAPDYWVLGFGVNPPVAEMAAEAAAVDKAVVARWPARARVCSALVSELAAWAEAPVLDPARWTVLLSPGETLRVTDVSGAARVVKPVAFGPCGRLVLADGGQLSTSQCLKSESLPATR